MRGEATLGSLVRNWTLSGAPFIWKSKSRPPKDVIAAVRDVKVGQRKAGSAEQILSAQRTIKVGFLRYIYLTKSKTRLILNGDAAIDLDPQTKTMSLPFFQPSLIVQKCQDQRL